MVKTHIIGFSRIDVNRDIKFELENFWTLQNKINEKSLISLKENLCENNWKTQIKLNLDYITVGDFSYYDNVLNTLVYFGAIPDRFNFDPKVISLKNYFEAARGNELQPPMEMTKWFNTNYHYLVPEYTINTNFNLNCTWLIDDIKKAKLLNHPIKITLLGPLTLLKLGKIKDNKLKNRLWLLPDLIVNLVNLINEINLFNIDLIQIEEPILALNISNLWIDSLKSTYNLLSSHFSNILLTTYFGEIKNYIKFLNILPVAGIHVDITNNNQINYLFENYPENKILSLGIIDGKNIWKNNIEKSYYIIKKIKINLNNLWISTSCSLAHVPIDINLEKFINKEIKNWLSFGIQKLNEIILLKNIILNKNKNLPKDFFKNIFYIEERKKSKLIFNYKVQNTLKNLNNLDFLYRQEYKIRKEDQNKNLNLPILPITTIGSFPQTQKIRKIRSNFKKNILEKSLYQNFIKKEIDFIINKQLEYDIDVLVHGEPERNDMVEYFAELINGFIVTQNGWVQSYGSRYVKPPIIYGDIYLLKPMTIDWINYAQSLTNRPVKGMLTGPITMFKWSFVRDDQPNYVTALQLSLVLKQEVYNLEKSGIKIIQIDEPAIREYLPLKKKNYKKYFNWSKKIFLISCNKINNNTQIHTHVCYSEFKNMLPYIISLDVDVISIETARSDMEILPLITNYPNELGLGIYDIHTKRKLQINYAIYLIKLIINYISEKKIWINPDCGLKTRKWNEINKSLKNMVNATKLIRKNIKL